MDKRTIKIIEIKNNNDYKKIFEEEIKKIREIPKMPDCEFFHIGATSSVQTLGEKIVDILVVVENLHEITTFDEKRLNNIKYHRIAHNGIKGVIKYARITDYFSMDYDVVLYVVQRGTKIHENFLKLREVLENEELKTEYIEFKEQAREYSFKEYIQRKVGFINRMLKKVEKMNKIQNISSVVHDSEVLFNEPLKKYSFTKTGGNAEALVKVKNEDDFQKVIKYCHENEEKLTILGNGSNVLISDNGIRGIVVITSDMNNIELDENNILSCYAGTTLKELTDFCIENSLSGLEFSCGIPGSVGGAIFMNAGAYGGEMKEVIEKVEVFDKKGNKKTYSNEEMQFSYRHSLIQETGEIISKVYFKMVEGNKEEIISRVNELNKMREDKQPLEYPSCGSVFKRPEGYFAGKLIQDAGLQGLTVGGAQVSKKHAGFMVNVDNATCEDYKNLIAKVQEEVKKQFNVELECEVKILGEE